MRMIRRFHSLILVLIMDKGFMFCSGFKLLRMGLIVYYYSFLQFGFVFLCHLQVWTYIFTNPHLLYCGNGDFWWVFAKFFIGMGVSTNLVGTYIFTNFDQGVFCPFFF